MTLERVDCVEKSALTGMSMGRKVRRRRKDSVRERLLEEIRVEREQAYDRERWEGNTFDGQKSKWVVKL